jgi:7,8-dihydro-6-hydroxymethylpterin-pyrophosphokinase
LRITQNIEKSMGRNQKGDFQPRVADIDIILFNDWQIHSDLLTIPHKRFRERKFVLLPLEAIAKDIIDPVTQLTIQELNEKCKDEIDFKIVP